jgi:hypothetical protein
LSIFLVEFYLFLVLKILWENIINIGVKKIKLLQNYSLNQTLKLKPNNLKKNSKFSVNKKKELLCLCLLEEDFLKVLTLLIISAEPFLWLESLTLIHKTLKFNLKKIILIIFMILISHLLMENNGTRVKLYLALIKLLEELLDTKMTMEWSLCLMKDSLNIKNNSLIGAKTFSLLWTKVKKS